MNITIIGGGNMARALLGGLIARGHGSDALAVVEIDAEARATVAARFGVATFAAIEPAAVGRRRRHCHRGQAAAGAQRWPASWRPCSSARSC